MRSGSWCCSFTSLYFVCFLFFFQAEDGIRVPLVTGVQTCALPILITCAQKWLASFTPSLSSAVKKGVKLASHFCAQVIRSSAVRESASFCRAFGSEHCKKALAHCRNRMPRSCRRRASQ